MVSGVIECACDVNTFCKWDLKENFLIEMDNEKIMFNNDFVIIDERIFHTLVTHLLWILP